MKNHRKLEMFQIQNFCTVLVLLSTVFVVNPKVWIRIWIVHTLLSPVSLHYSEKNNSQKHFNQVHAFWQCHLMWGQFKYWYKTCVRLFESHWILSSIIKKMSFTIKIYKSCQLFYKSIDSKWMYFSIRFTGWLEKFITLPGIIWWCWYENCWQMSIWLR